MSIFIYVHTYVYTHDALVPEKDRVNLRIDYRGTSMTCICSWTKGCSIGGTGPSAPNTIGPCGLGLVVRENLY